MQRRTSRLTSNKNLQGLQRRIGSAQWCDWITQRYQMYDHVRLTQAGTNQLSFFRNPVGTADPVSTLVKTLEQTNLTKANTFGQIYFVLQQIRTYIHILPKVRQNAEISADANMTASATIAMQKVRDLIGMGVLNINLGQKQYFDIPQPFRACPPCFGLDIQSLPTISGAVSEYVTQSNDPADAFNVTPEQMIEPEQVIEATIDFPNGNTPNFAALVDSVEINIGLIFHGWVARPVQ